jgi:hypothetical protein
VEAASGEPPPDLLYCRFLLTHLRDPARALAAWASATPDDRATLVVEETAEMSSTHPAFRLYYALVGTLQRHYGQELTIGRTLDRALVGSGWHAEISVTRELALPAARMARLHQLNLATWRHDPSGWARAHLGMTVQVLVFAVAAIVLFAMRSRDLTAQLSVLALALSGVAGGGPLLGVEGTIPFGMGDVLTVFATNLDPASLAVLYRQAHCLLYPSLFEGFGLPLVEAMQLGCPVIASNRSVMPEIAGDAALLVDGLDVAAMASALEAVADPALRNRLIAHGRSRAAQFSWDKSAAQHAGVYRSLGRHDAVPVTASSGRG